MSDVPVRALVVGTGAIGGIGRYERLLTAALEDLQRRELLRFEALWRRTHPSYLETQANAGDGGEVDVACVPLRRFVPDFVRALHRVRPDVVLFLHTNLAQLAPLARALRPCSYIVSTYGEEVWQRLSPAKRMALQRATAIWSISKFTAEEMTSAQSLAPPSIRLIHPALEPSWFAAGAGIASRRDWSTSGGMRLLSVSRLVPEARNKGIDDVLRALPRALEDAPNLEYRVVGEGDDRTYLENLARQSGVAGRVTFTGAVTHVQLLEEYRNCDAFILPSEREGFGLVFLEAMAFSKPVIARQAAAAAEVVVHGETGLLVNGEADLASAICDFARDPRRAWALGEAGRRRAEELYSFDKFVADVHEGMVSALQERERRAVYP